MTKQKVKKGSRITNECIVKAQLALNAFTEDELKEYIANVFNTAEKYKNTLGEGAIKAAMDEVNNDTLAALLNKTATKARNIGKFERLNSKLKKAIPLDSLLITTAKNKDDNIERAQIAARNDLMEKTHTPLSNDQVKLFSGAKFDEQIAAAADGLKVDDINIETIGKMLRDYPERIRNPLMLESDALNIDEVNAFRLLQQVHDSLKISRAGQNLKQIILNKGFVNPLIANQTWRNDLLRLINVEETAKARGALAVDGGVDMAKLTKSLDKTFDNIIHQKSLLETRSVVANDRDALERKRHLTIVFKDWRSFNEYNQKYGKGTLYNALLSDIHGAANRIGLSQIFGDNPISMFHDLKMRFREEQKAKGKSGTLGIHRSELLFKEVANLDKASWSMTLANAGATARMLSSMSALGNIVFKSLNDISQMAAISQRFGFNYWESYVRGIVHAFGLIPTKSRAHFARYFKANIESQMGNVARFVDATTSSDFLHKVSNIFYKLNLTHAWDYGLKMSGMDSIAMGLGRASFKTWEALNEQTRSQLSRFNFTKAEWETLRTKTQDKLFTLDNVDTLSDSELKNLWEQSDKSYSLSEYKRALRLKVFSFFDAASENSVLDPRAFERLVGTWGTAEGTPTGQLARAFMQFKMYPIASMRRTWGQGLQEMDGYQAKVMYGLNLAAGNFALGYLSLVLGNLMQGLSMPDPARMSLAEKEKFYFELLAPGLGLFSRILSPNNQQPDLLLNFFFTPTIKLIGEPVAAMGALVTGDPKKSAKLAKDFANNANPIRTFPIAQPYIDSFMGKKAYLQPGQTQLFGK